MTELRLLAEPIVGYRYFAIKPDGRVFAQYSDVEWPSFPVAFKAKCEVNRYFGSMPTFAYMKNPSNPEVLEYKPFEEPHAAPCKECACGIHIYYDLSRLYGSSLAHYTVELVVGLVAGWGDVIPHPDGFRCSDARICAFAGNTTAIRRAAENCDVPTVLSRTELMDLAPEFGGSMPSQLIPSTGDRPSNTVTADFLDKLRSGG